MFRCIGGMALHEGRIAEMKTGEGKTLVGTLPVYLNALLVKVYTLLRSMTIWHSGIAGKWDKSMSSWA